MLQTNWIFKKVKLQEMLECDVTQVESLNVLPVT